MRKNQSVRNRAKKFTFGNFFSPCRERSLLIFPSATLGKNPVMAMYHSRPFAAFLVHFRENGQKRQFFSRRGLFKCPEI